MTGDHEQKIRERAYFLWEQEDSERGRHEDRWRRARKSTARMMGRRSHPTQACGRREWDPCGPARIPTNHERGAAVRTASENKLDGGT
jgi:hypothetical protein